MINGRKQGNLEETRFRMSKDTTMQKLDKALKEKKVDSQMISFLQKFNKLKNYFTSSSCAGRIILLGLDKEESKKPNLFVGKWHRKVKLLEITTLLEKDSSFDEIWFKQESFIFHFVCKNLTCATKLLEIKTNFGIKRGGIFQIEDGRYIIELMNTSHISFPVKLGKEIIIDKQNLEKIVKKANTKLERNYKLLKEFQKTILKELKMFEKV